MASCRRRRPAGNWAGGVFHFGGWIILYPLAEQRRNLTDGWKFQLAQVERELLLAIGKEARDARLKQNTDLSLNDKTEEVIEPHNTREVIAAELGWSSGKTAQAWRADPAPEGYGGA